MTRMDEKESVNSKYPERLLDMYRMSELCAIFTMDMQSRYSGGAELYDAPMLVQRVEPGLKVTQSYTIGNDGARKDFEAEEYGVYSNAPEWYKMMQRDRVKPLFDNMKEDDAKKGNEDQEKEQVKKKKKKKNKFNKKKKKKGTSDSAPSDAKEDGHATDHTVEGNHSYPCSSLQ